MTFCQFMDKGYDFKGKSTLRKRTDKTVYFGCENIPSLTTKLWKFIPELNKKEKSLASFKKINKIWTTD